MSTSISTGIVASSSRTRANAAATPPAAATWLSFTSAMSDSPIRWFAPPPQRTAYFCSARRPGMVLRVSRTVADVPSSASAHRRVMLADTRQVTQQVQRRALGGEQQAAWERSPGRRRCRLRPGTRRRTRYSISLASGPHTVSITAATTGSPATTPVLAGTEGGDAALVGGDGGGRRDVDATHQVLLDGQADQRCQRIGIQSGSDQLIAGRGRQRMEDEHGGTLRVTSSSSRRHAARSDP